MTLVDPSERLRKGRGQMGRLRSRSLLVPDPLEAKIRSSLEGTDLAPVGHMLEKLIHGSRGADGTWNGEGSQAALHHVEHLLERLPIEQGERFVFDAKLIQAISQVWNGAAVPLSGAIVPAYGGEWRLDREPLYPGGVDDQVHLLELLVIRGRNSVEDIDLTEYGWIVHELAHSLLHKNAPTAIRLMQERVSVPLRDLQVGTVPDRGHAKTVRQSQLEQILKFWTPTRNQLNWVHELISDVIGIAVAGPAYGRTFLEDTSADDIRPFELTQSHPPFAVRCGVLRAAAEMLGWADLALRLGARVQEWGGSRESNIPDNAYLAATDETLIAAGIDAAFDVVRALRLPKCSPEQQRIAREKVEAGEPLELGIEVLLGAWCASDTMDISELRGWTAATVRGATTSGSNGNAANLV